MFVRSESVWNCDSCGKSGTPGVACIAQGATGRWCEVLSFCEACVNFGSDVGFCPSSASKLTPIEDAVKHACKTGSCDFWHLVPDDEHDRLVDAGYSW